MLVSVKSRFKGLFFFLLLFFVAVPMRAQEVLQDPEAFLGYPLGSRYTEHHRVIDYFEYVSTQLPNVYLEQYGETYEGRPLVTAFIASPDKFSSLEEIRQNNLRRAGLLEGTPTEDKTAIIWLSYNVHGNETVSTEAALKTLYKLANPEDEQSRAWLENSVVIMDPCLNPDGRDRYVNWYMQVAGRFPDANPSARENSEPWPRGRTNHYYFDLNRDWSWLTQKEVQARVAHYSKWMPHVHVDFHEQGINSPYYFAPASEPLHEVISDWQRRFQAEIGQNHARYFDANNWLYFTREVFDLFYPGYGDTWPMYNGSIGMTYEQGGGGAGVMVQTAEGDTLTLADRIEHHHTTGISTVEVTSINNTRVVDAFAEYYQLATMSPAGPYRSYVLKGMSNQGKRMAITKHLEAQGIEYGFAASDRSDTGYHYHTEETGAFTVETGDLIISAYQPKSNLVKVLLEPQPNLPDSVTYDITSWALPYVYGLEAFALESQLVPEADTYPLEDEASSADVETPYAYLARWESFRDAQFLAALLNEDIKLRYAQTPFRIEGRDYGAGTLIITRTGNERIGERFDTIIQGIAETMQKPIHAVRSGLVETGSDFGSNDVLFLDKPRIATLYGSTIRSSSLGQLWHYFDQQLGYPITQFDATSFSVARLDDYDVLVLPAGSYSSILNAGELADLAVWVSQGGRIIALENAVGFLAGKESFAVKQKQRNSKPDSTMLVDRKYGERRRDAAGNAIPGAIFKVNLDNTHPLGFGYPEYYYTLKRSANTFQYLEKNSDWNVGTIRKNALLSGFAGTKTLPHIEESLALGVQRMGRGTVTYLVDDPLFRAFWYNGRLLLANALFMVQ